MSQVRRLCANCMCYHCQQFVLPPEPFCNFTLPFKDRVSHPSTSIEYSEAQNIESRAKAQNQQLMQIISRVDPQTPIKRIDADTMDHKMRNYTISTERNERTNHRFDNSFTPTHRRIHESPRPSSVQIKKESIIRTVPPPPQPRILNTFTRPLTPVLPVTNYQSVPNIRYVPSIVSNDVEPKRTSTQNNPQKIKASDLLVKFDAVEQTPIIPVIPNQFLGSKFVEMPTLSNLVDKSKGLISNPDLISNKISITRRKKVQKCTYQDNRCLGVDLRCDAQNQVLVDETGHVKTSLRK